MKRHDSASLTWLDPVGLGLLLLATVAIVLLIPAFPFTRLTEPSYFGAAAFFVLLPMIGWQRVARGRGTAGERRWLTAFLAGMPLIYVGNWIRYGTGWGWLLLELLGLVAFAGVALLVARRRPWWLAGGIAAHGLWDLAHLGSGSSIPDWYATLCGIVDAALAVYVAAQVPLWIERRRRQA